MEKAKMTTKERELLDSLDQYIHRWSSLNKPTEEPPEIPLYRFQAASFNAICDKVKQGMVAGTVDPEAKTYRGVPIRCQY